MKLKMSVLLFFVVVHFSAHADEPASTFMSDLVQSAGDNLWWVYPQEIGGQTITPPKGGYLFRFKIDMKGDGVDEVFLISSLDVTKGSEPWTFYRGDTGGSYIKLSENLSLNGSLRMKSISGVKRYSFVTPPDQETGRESILSFWLDGSGSLKTSTRDLTDEESTAITGGDKALLGANGLPDDDKIAQRFQLGEAVNRALEKVLVGKLYQNPNAPWRAVSNNFALSQQYLDPADAADIASLAGWQPPP